MVNLASRMESKGEVGKIMVTKAVKDGIGEALGEGNEFVFGDPEMKDIKGFGKTECGSCPKTCRAGYRKLAPALVSQPTGSSATRTHHGRGRAPYFLFFLRQIAPSGSTSGSFHLKERAGWRRLLLLRVCDFPKGRSLPAKGGAEKQWLVDSGS